MRVAVYSRKSKITDRGESVLGQIELCRAYAVNSLGAQENEITVYDEGEGYSGGSVERPQFARMMRDIGEFDALVCYRLDRISRNVSDFCNILEKLNATGTAFISITERFDTSTPMGRAMVNIAAVFAQLERETTAERIRDNMRRLALTGRFIGSTPPFGFRSETVTDGGKKQHRLAPVCGDIDFIKLLFDKYIEFGSLSKLSRWIEGHHSKQARGVSSLRRTLSNPAYVRADGLVCEYYSDLGARVVNAETADGSRGMLIHGRHDRNGAYAPEKWTVVTAGHEGIIPSERWLAVQRMLEENKTKAPRAGTSSRALLAAKLYCGGCGAGMAVTYGGDRTRYYYKCRNKIHSRGGACDMPNAHGTDADDAVFDYIEGLPYDTDLSVKLLKKYSARSGGGELARQSERAIRNLTARLRECDDSAAAKHIIAEIERLDAEVSRFKDKQALSAALPAGWDKITELNERRGFLNSVVDKIVWDGTGFCVDWRVENPKNMCLIMNNP
jgi:site-specific DNA recombinase